MKYIKTSILLLLTAIAPSLYGAFESSPYAGLKLSMTHTKGERTENYTRAHTDTPLAKDKAFTSDNIAGDIFAGYLHRFDGTAFAASMELSIGYAQMQDELLVKAGNVKMTIIERQWSFSAPVRLGYVAQDQFFIYGIASPELSVFRYFARDQFSHGINATTRPTLWGIRYGAGIEAEFQPIRVALEVTQTNFEKKEINNYDNYSDNTFHLNSEINVLAASLKLTYIF